MADTPTRMGFEGLIYRGTAGSTAATLMESATDISFTITPDKANTTVRGTGATPPKKTERVVAIGFQIEFTLLNVSGESHVGALRTAAAAGTPVSIRTKDYSGGGGFDGDCTIDCKEGHPIGGEQTFAFTCTPTGEKGRQPTYA